MVNERGHFPEVCKKSIQAMAADLQPGIPPAFWSKTSLQALAAMTPRRLEALGRLTQPLYAGAEDSHYRPIEWPQALDLVADRMRAASPDRSFFYFSGRSSNEAGFLLQVMARLYGTNNVNNCSYFCHQASGVGLSSVTGSGTATVRLEDVENCDLLFLIGGNPASNHPRLMSTLVRMKRGGGKVIVVNPLRETGLVRFKVPSDPRSLLFGTRIADEYVQPHVGGDIAFLIGVARSLIESGHVDRKFLSAFTSGWDQAEQVIAGTAWDKIIEASGVDRPTIERVAAIYAGSEKTIFAWAMGITHHSHGVENVQMIANLGLMRGMVGKPNAGLLPLRGHSNVQGIGSMGATPALKLEVMRAIESRYSIALPTEPGLDTLACIERAADGDIDFAWHLGGNLYGSAPDSESAETALRRIGTTVFLSTTLNQGHIRGRGRESVILPVLARDEEPEATTQESMFNFVRLSDGGRRRHRGPLSEVQVISAVGKRALPDRREVLEALERHRDIRAAIGAIVPGYTQIAVMDETGQEFHIDGRTFHEPVFSTESGRASFHPVTIPEHISDEGTLRLMTVRSEGQFNTVVYEEEDIYRGQGRRDVVMLNPADIDRLGLKVGDPVTVSSSAGVMAVTLSAIDIREGNAVMYYPEANALVPMAADPRSRTPAFKNTAVTVAAR
jgi:molybdopterin-dependent oxidoreductase alpha subunit